MSGQFFPRTADPTTINLALDCDTTNACLGGATELEWRPSSGSPHVDKLPSNGLSCTSRYAVNTLTAATGYRFRARDCDALTCSPWSAPVTLTTAPAAGPGAVALTIDGASLGSATVGVDGTFDANVTIPSGTAAGNRNDCVVIDMTSNNLNPYLELRFNSPDGPTLRTNDDGGRGVNAHLTQRLTFAGTYYVFAGTSGSGADYGQYSLIVNRDQSAC